MAANPHIVAIPFPPFSHINPLIHLCERLQAFGFRITFINSHENHKNLFRTQEPITRNAIRFISVPSIPDNVPHSAAMDGIEAMIQVSNGLRPSTEELIEHFLRSGNQVRCIISDSFLGWVQEIAKKHNIPRVAFNTSTATFELVAIHMRRLRNEGFMPVNTRTTGDKLIEFIPGMPSLSPLDIPLGFYDEHPIVDFVTEQFEKLLEADWILSSTFEKLEADALGILRGHFGAKNYLSIGPFLPDSHIHPTFDKAFDRAGLTAEGIECLEWLDRQLKSSVLYVAFGSFAVLSAEQFLELMAALEESNCVIIWVVRPGLVEDLPLKELEGFVERTKERVHLVRCWAPQLHILRNAAVGGFLTHCGWNSITESLCAGVPMIGWPCWAEQNLNCSFLVKNKLALGLQKSGSLIRRQDIVKAVSDLISGQVGEEMRKNVGDIAEEVRKALSEGGTSHSNLEYFAKTMLNS